MDKQRIYPVVWHFADDAGVTKELGLLPEGMAYLAQKGCTCRPLPMPEVGIVMISGEGDCPVHGFGAFEDQEVE